MPFTIDVHEAHNLAIALCDGLLREDEIHDAIGFSFAIREVSGLVDRVVRIEPTADLRELHADALRRIHAHVVRASSADGAMPVFRSVLIAPSPFHRPIAELYKAIWDGTDFPHVEFSVVTTPTEASLILGLPIHCTLLIGPPARGRRGA